MAVPELVWTDCGAGAQCSTAQVPRNYLDLAATSLELAIARRPASDPAQRIGSLFVNFGGPGVPAYDLVAESAADLFGPEVLARFDIVGVDPRGIGRSTPVECYDTLEEQFELLAGLAPFPVTRVEEARRIRAGVELGRACEDKAGGLLDVVSTTAFARDLDVLRAAVGDEQITYVGYSYGTYLGSVYANLFPGRVRAAVLDGVLDPVDYTSGPRGTVFTARLEGEQGAYAALLQFFRTCEAAGEQACLFAQGGDAQAKYDELAAALRSRPIELEGPEGPVSVTYAVLVQGTMATLSAPASWAGYAAALQELYAAIPAGGGEGSRLRALPAVAGRGAQPVGTRRRLRAGPRGRHIGGLRRGRDRPQPAALRAHRAGAGPGHAVLRLAGGLEVQPVRELARRGRGSLHRPLERPHREPRADRGHPLRPVHQLRLGGEAERAAGGQQAAHARRLRPHRTAEHLR